MKRNGRSYGAERACEYCSKPFCPKRDARKGQGLYCSIQCSGLSRSKPVAVPVAEVVRLYVEENMTIVEIAKAINACWKSVSLVLKREGVTRPGGRPRGKGYITTAAPDKHPNKNCNGRIAMHRLVAAEALGRALHRDEVVHHIDGSRHNNEASNLSVMSRQEHAAVHHSLETAAYRLLLRGLVVFTEGQGYALSPSRDSQT